MKKSIFFLPFLFFIHGLLPAQEYIHPSKDDPGYLGESQYFRFYQHFWLNTHHFLHNRASIYDGKNLGEVFDEKITAKMQKRDFQALKKAIDFYKKNLAGKDLRTGEYLAPFKRWVIQQTNKPPLPAYELSTEHTAILNDFASTYKKFFWKKHKKANLLVFQRNIRLVKKLEQQAVKRLTELSQREWQKEKIRVDLAYYSKLNRPFTTTRPTTHIVMETYFNHEPQGNWFELLFHEASHHLIFPSGDGVGKTIIQAANDLGLESRAYSQMWHLYLFYFTGRVSEALLEKELDIDYELYMVRNKVFSQSFPKADQYLPLYMSGEKSLLEVSKKMLE